MAKGDSGSQQPSYQSPMPLGNFGMPRSGQGISPYGMSSIMPSMAMLQFMQQRQAAQPQYGFGGASVFGPQFSGGSPFNSAGYIMNSPGMFRQFMNPGFNFNTPISTARPPMMSAIDSRPPMMSAIEMGMRQMPQGGQDIGQAVQRGDQAN